MLGDASTILFPDVKPDSPCLRCLRRNHELSDRVEDDPELGVVFLFQFIESAGQVSTMVKPLALRRPLSGSPRQF